MSESLPPPSKRCSQCGAELPDAGTNGLCPACLMAEAMKPSSPAKGPWQPPSAEELAKLLPQYEITRMLGRGGMGAVYQGTQKSLDRAVAIKILSNDLETADASFAERFKNEARAMAKLSHPGIVAVFDSGETSTGLLYIVMEFIEGTDVAKMIAQQKRLHTEHAMAITAHVCDALAYAHERGIIHRDIKPANIMVGYDGVVKVADFGLAKMTQSQNSGLTQSGMAMGTLHYMAPEALMLGAGVDHRADIYAVGVMLYQMLTGKVPHGMFELPSLQVPGLDPRYDSIISRAMREDREVRYQAAAELRHDLDAILTQPVVKVEAAAEKAPAALETLARPQRPGGQPYRPPQPEVIVRTENKGVPMLWVALLAMSGIAGWLVLNKDSGKGSEKLPDAAVSAAPVPAPVSNKQLTAGGPTASTTNPAEATKDRPFVNSLGMKFVPVPDSNVLFCIHETRQKDFEAYAAQAQITRGAWRDQSVEGVAPKENPLDHPVLRISWEDAQDFCAWLSKKEGKIYRLPTDREWSIAVGLGSKEVWTKDTTPEELHHKVIDEWPWGSKWPPIQNAGNYSDISRKLKAPAKYIENFDDGFPGVAPVMRFEPNSFGIYDMGGNAWEWCEDWYNAKKMTRVLRGGSWPNFDRTHLLSSTRDHRAPNLDGHEGYGFRCVLEVANQPALTTMPPVVPQAIPQPTQATTTSDSTSPSTVGDPPNTTKRVIDLLALVDLKKDALRGEWTSVEDGILGGTGIESGRTGLQCLQFPHAVTAIEYDFEIVLSQKEGPTRSGFSMQFPAAGTTITLGTQVYAKMDKPWYGFLNLDGKGALGPSKDFYIWREPYVAGVKYRSTVKVRKNSLTGMMDGKVLVHWEGDLTRFKSSGEKVSDSRFLAAVASTGYGTIIHKATLTEFAPQALKPSAPALPTGPTTWTDTKGRSITATFKAIASGNVLLDIAGKVTPVPLNTLSAESQKLARDYHEQSNSNTTDDPAQATKDRPFVNSLGMKFVPVPGTNALFCIHETRRKDYAAFAKTNPGIGGNWESAVLDDKPLVGEPFDNHPVAKVSRHDAESFCKWLSSQSLHNYRLPTDEEWSVAAGFDETREEAETPNDLHNKAVSKSAARIYPWGTDWPPPADAGNYAGPFTPEADTFPSTAPVMTFRANQYGLYDLGGNLREWVSDRFWNKDQTHGTLRGGAWSIAEEISFRSGYRFGGRLGDGGVGFGFRVIIELAASRDNAPPVSPVESKPAQVVPPSAATKDSPFTNSLGMKFVSVPGTKVLFSIWHTRVKDYEKFVLETQRFYKAPEYEQGPTHPVMNIKWEDAKAFCDWLSRKEKLEYRLPQDAEWSTAAGDTVYPWGNDASVPKGFGNFHGAYRAESFAHTTPVGSFPADKHGLYDMGGNAHQWCEDIYDPSLNESVTLEKFPHLKKAKSDDGTVWHVTRGSSWGFLDKVGLRASFRNRSQGGTGFRCVIVIGSTASPASATPAPP